MLVEHQKTMTHLRWWWYWLPPTSHGTSMKLWEDGWRRGSTSLCLQVQSFLLVNNGVSISLMKHLINLKWSTAVYCDLWAVVVQQLENMIDWLRLKGSDKRLVCIDCSLIKDIMWSPAGLTHHGGPGAKVCWPHIPRILYPSPSSTVHTHTASLCFWVPGNNQWFYTGLLAAFRFVRSF